MKLIAYPSVPPKSSYIHLGYLSSRSFPYKVKADDPYFGLSILSSVLLSLMVASLTASLGIKALINDKKKGQESSLRLVRLVLFITWAFVIFSIIRSIMHIDYAALNVFLIVVGLYISALLVVTIDHPVIQVIRSAAIVRIALLSFGFVNLAIGVIFIFAGLSNGRLVYNQPRNHLYLNINTYMSSLEFDSIKAITKQTELPSVDDIVSRFGPAPLDAWERPMPLKNICLVGDEKKVVAFIFLSNGEDGVSRTKDDYFAVAEMDDTLSERLSITVFLRDENPPEYLQFLKNL